MTRLRTTNLLHTYHISKRLNKVLHINFVSKLLEKIEVELCALVVII